MINLIHKEAQEKMKKSIEVTAHEFASLRIGRASPAMVENVKVECYGTLTPLLQVASINVTSPKELEIKPWDKNILSAIDKAILSANLGFTPVNDGKVVRINIPPLTEERRKELIKVLKKVAEDGKVSIRNLRRVALDKLRELQKKKEISDDDFKKAQEHLQHVTDDNIKKIDELSNTKEKEIMTV